MKIAIASGKGGTGKTTLAVNLASYIAEEKKNLNVQEVVLVDMDVEEPNSGLFIKGELKRTEIKYRMVPEWIESKCTFCKKCANVCNFNALAYIGVSVLIFPELCHSCYACSELCPEDALPMKADRMGELRQYIIKNGLHFIESRLDIGIEQAVPLIKQTHEFIDSEFDETAFKIIDSPPGTSCPVIETVKDAELVLLVTEPTPFGLNDLKLAVDTMNELDKKCAVIVNRDGIGNDDVDKYCAENDIPLIGKIPHMHEAAKLYSQGNLLIDDIDEIRDVIKDIYSNIKKLVKG
jgi:MinD superfamily P-loop ATPase